MNTAIQSDDNVLKAILTGSFAGVLVLVLAIFLFWIVRLRKRNRARKDGQSEEGTKPYASTNYNKIV